MSEARIVQMADGRNKEVIYAFLYRGGAFTFAGKTFPASPSAQSFAIAALDQNNKLLWSQDVAGKGNQGAKTTDIFVAPNGDIFVFGQFTSEITLGTQTLKPTDSSAQPYDLFGFIAKLNAQGQWQGAQLLEISRLPSMESPFVELHSIARTSNGDLYLSGSYQGKLRFLSSSIDNLARQAFVLRINSQLQSPLFARTISGATPSTVDYTSLVIDENDKTYLLGQANGEVVFGTHKLTSSSTKAPTGFLVRFDLQVADPWVVAPYALPPWPFSNNHANVATAATGGGVVWAGSYTKAFQISNIRRPDPPRSTAYIASIDGSGTMRWLKESTGPSDTESSFVRRSPTKELQWVVQANDAIQFGRSTHPYPYQGGDAPHHVAFFLNENGDLQASKTLWLGELLLSGLRIGIRSVLLRSESALIGGSIQGSGFTLYGKTYQPTGTEDVFLFRSFYR